MNRVDTLIEMSAKVVQLYDWVGERKGGQLKARNDSLTPDHKAYAEGSVNAYGNVRLYMRKFFAGLIDFEENERNTNG